MGIKKQWLSLEEFEKIQGGDWSPGPHTHVKVDITDTPWAWTDVLKTGSNLTDLATRQHAGLTDVMESQHHNKLHSMTGVQHSAAGLTVGWVIKATGATTFAWGQLPHDKLAGLGDDDHAQYLLASGARVLTGNWDAGGYQIRALKFYSDQATGTAPFAVLSTTMVTNLNVDRWHGCGVSGLTIGHVLKATGAAAIAFQANNLGGLSDLNLGSLEEGETLAYDQGSGKWIDAWGVEYDNPRLVWKMYTDFFSAGTTSNDPWVGAVLINGTMIARAGETNHPGQVRLNSGDSAQSGYRWMTATDCILLSGAESSEFIFKSPINLSDVRIRLGFQDSLNDVAPTDGMYIDINGTTLKGITRNNGSETVTGTTYTISISTWYRIKMALSSDKATATFWLYNASGTQLWTNTTTTNIPTGAGRTLGHGVVAWIGVAAGQILIDLDMMVTSQAGTITR